MFSAEKGDVRFTEPVEFTFIFDSYIVILAIYVSYYGDESRLLPIIGVSGITSIESYCRNLRCRCFLFLHFTIICASHYTDGGSEFRSNFGWHFARMLNRVPSRERFWPHLLPDIWYSISQITCRLIWRLQHVRLSDDCVHVRSSNQMYGCYGLYWMTISLKSSGSDIDADRWFPGLPMVDCDSDSGQTINWKFWPR